ncbi:hypothetical protein GCM10017635_20170 [Paracoccus kondratievae]|uniref:Uncharacterized protein n=1 Tax=Paracoccus kondratievae TaxID=135740 RepID=A0AAD3RU69_9RHOB|nr:hypothetical protein GCM10017635_20170 [Paracoccus kondratievae]
MLPLTGPANRDKETALFPRRLDGHSGMIARQDNENLFPIRSDDLLHRPEGERTAAPCTHGNWRRSAVAGLRSNWTRVG